MYSFALPLSIRDILTNESVSPGKEGERIRTRESEQDQENKSVLTMEVCSERELLQETWLKREDSSAYL
jgi:hypothetical protein